MNVDEMVRRAAPARVDGWAESAQGRTVLAGVRMRSVPRKSRTVRRIVGAVAVTGALVGASAAAWGVFGEEPPKGWHNPTGGVACADKLGQPRGLYILQPSDANAIDQCRDWWRTERRTEPPEPLFGCVIVMDDNDGGALIVVPGAPFKNAADACREAGMYAAPPEAIANPGR
ncbi:hypothetical protein Val02_36170 [Virgisporangium aliadipatigenens]|uniref:Uncharacterized protein n=1 Tax=Virgisporangium aliadipatigenens TaxID=741659 RepID=A0A8J3YMU5_9ACTN|nr:hypothetical protein [Virgisporangium aliadipatigenens]GIJ46731.1 hypothetical protein Val02_36170 [Virgisporangium aliadipatigenens]